MESIILEEPLSIKSNYSSSTTTTTAATSRRLPPQAFSQPQQRQEQQPQQISPDTFISTTNASQFSYQRPSPSPPPPPPPPPSAPTGHQKHQRQQQHYQQHQQQQQHLSSSPDSAISFNESFGENIEVARLLKDTPSHILPIVERFISSHFENPQKALDHSEFSETEIPMKHYWQRVFKHLHLKPWHCFSECHNKN
uniref:Uncharacterized protein n=1 Tax=Panagrolaimus superbus TaxID=310955 RepID=A0A914YF48_9BILA